MNKKSGITLASLVVYLVLFVGLTAFVAAISTNMNERLFYNRGQAINYTNLDKLQYNIENSSLKSDDVSYLDDKVVYSNGDIYEYDESRKTVLKNEGILCSNVESFTCTVSVVEGVKQLKIDVSFNKYLNITEKVIISSVEVI